MNEASTSAPEAAAERSWERLPSWLRPRTSEWRGSGQLRLIETTLLVLAGVLLSAATLNDVHRQVGINHRLSADLQTWRHYTGHAYHNLTVDQELLGAGSEHEVVCGNATPGAPKTRPQICLAIWGPTINGTRTVHGGWYLRAKVEYDVRSDRYDCFGRAAEGKCPP